MSWRRAIYRWNRRMVRREARQWSLVIAMIAGAVAVGVTLVTAVFNVTPPPNSLELGNGNQLVEVRGAADPALLTDAASSFEVADPVERALVRAPGFAAPIEVRSFDPDGRNAGTLIRLIDGSFPESDREIAATRNELERLGGRIGGSVTVEDTTLLVTGVVENPARLSDDFLFATPGVFAPTDTRLLITGTDEAIEGFLVSHPGVSRLDFVDDTRTVTTVIVTIAAALVFLEIALIVVSIVTMLAQRRRRHLGLLAAAGANRRQLRASVISAGAIAGVTAATLGLAAGLVAGGLIVPTLDGLADRRIDGVVWPWPSIVAIALIASLTAVAASWWPARRVTGQAVHGALRSTRPDQRPPILMTVIGAATLLSGVVGLVAVFSLDDTDRPLFVDVAAFLAVPLGAVLLAPAAVRTWVRLAPARSLSARVAWRDIARFPARSSATAASLVVVLTVPIIGASGFRIFERSPENVPTMAPNQLLVQPDADALRGGSGGDLSSFDEQIAALAGAATAVPLRQPIFDTGGDVVGPVVVDSGPFGGSTADTSVARLREPLVFGVVTDVNGGDFGIDVIPTYVGTPELLDALGLDEFRDSDVVTNRDGPHGIVRYLEEDVGLDQSMAVDVRDFARFSHTPGALLSPGYAETLGLDIETTGWLIQADEPIPNGDIARLSEQVGRLGFGLRAHEPVNDGRTTVLIILAASLLFALGIVAVVGSLHRAETASTHAAFEAAGASRRFRRRVHAWTMAALTAVAALLAVVAGLLSQLGFAQEVLGTGRLHELVPVGTTVGVLVLAPMLSFGLGWWTGPIRRSSTDLGLAD